MPQTKKQILRELIWELLEVEGLTRFPKPVHGRIPNFVGADSAANTLLDLDIWQTARHIKSNPDSPQLAVRELALKSGKVVYMAVPRLRKEKCFIKLDPKSYTTSATIKNAMRYGIPVDITEMKKIDLVVVGSVAVDRQGGRVGKGGGYSDLEYAILRTIGVIDEHTPVITTVHELQVVSPGVPMEPHDVPVDYIISPGYIFKTQTKHKKPPGIDWHIIDEQKINAIPVLQKLRSTK